MGGIAVERYSITLTNDRERLKDSKKIFMPTQDLDNMLKLLLS